jgi:anti-anti-sigma regulatory factor
VTVTAYAPFTRTVARLVVSVCVESGSTVIALRGRCDAAALPTLVDVICRVIADHDGTVIVDLAETTFINTATLGALDRARQFLDDRGRQLTLRSPSGLALDKLGTLEFSRLVEPCGT